MILDLPRFIASRQPHWRELEARLERMEADPLAALARLELADLKRLHLLYQQAAADLAQLRTFAAEPELCRHMESLVARAYAQVHETRGAFSDGHAGRGTSALTRAARRAWRWFWVSFPAAFGRHAGTFRLSVAACLLGAIFGAGVTLADPAGKEALLPFEHLMGSPSERVAKEEAAKKDRLSGVKATFSSQLMANNIRVSILTFALGITFGLGTLVCLFYNGVILGAVVADYLADGQALFLTGWLLPHGSVEIPSILIAGQAGLMLGAALVGHGSRWPLGTRMRTLAPDLVTLIGGLAVLLVWAGIIEAFISQYHAPALPYWAKIAFGAVQLILLAAFLGRRLPGQRERETLDSSASATAATP